MLESRRFVIVACSLLAGVAVSKASPPPNVSDASGQQHSYEISPVQRQMVPMRDGVRLATYTWTPVGVEGPVPVVLQSMHYDPGLFGIALEGTDPPTDRETAPWFRVIHRWVSQGYAFVYQTHRGRYESEGRTADYYRVRVDAHDTMDWIVKQPWSNGNIGTSGCSAGGASAMLAATVHHPNHKAAIMRAGGGGIGNFYDRFTATDGLTAYNSPTRMLYATWQIIVGDANLEGLSPEEAIWQLPLSRHFPRVEERDRSNSIPSAQLDVSDTWSVPVLFMNGWADHDPTGQIAIWKWGREFGAVTRQAKAHQHLLMFPGGHCVFPDASTSDAIVGERSVGDPSEVVEQQIAREFFAAWVKGEQPPPDLSPMLYYVPGKSTWRAVEQWPPTNVTYRDYYLTSSGEAATSMTDGALSMTRPVAAAEDTYNYDPMNPTPTKGGMFCCMANVGMRPGSFDQRAIESRADVLVYSSPPLTEGMEIAGPIGVTLYVSSDVRGTDFIAKLVDVYPDGRAYNIRRRAVMARYRNGATPEYMEPGEVYEIRFQMMDVANYFAPGHRIRLEVMSSDFPHYARNLNTGADNWSTSEIQIATNTVHHSPEHPSKLVLPVLLK